MSTPRIVMLLRAHSIDFCAHACLPACALVVGYDRDSVVGVQIKRPCVNQKYIRVIN
jgi:hypothetical protein